jgi:hypothetical protein
MNVYYKNGKVLIELDKNVGDISDILDYLKIKEIFYKSSKYTQSDINKISDEVTKSYYNNYFQNILKKRGILENSN